MAFQKLPTILIMALALSTAMHTFARPAIYPRQWGSSCRRGLMLIEEFENSCPTFKSLNSYYHVGGLFPVYVPQDKLTEFCDRATECINDWRNSNARNVSDKATPYSVARFMCSRDPKARGTGINTFIRVKDDILSYSCTTDSEGSCYGPVQNLLGTIPQLVDPNYQIQRPDHLCRPCVQDILQDIIKKYSDIIFLGVPKARRDEFLEVVNSCESTTKTEDLHRTAMEAHPVETHWVLKNRANSWKDDQRPAEKPKPYMGPLQFLGLNRRDIFGGRPKTRVRSTAPSPIKLANWKPCSHSYMCSSGCCSNEYSSEYKCTPFGTSSKCIFDGSASESLIEIETETASESETASETETWSETETASESETTSETETMSETETTSVPTTGIKLTDWKLCQDSAMCLSGCCSNEYSADFKCTPAGTSSKCIFISSPIVIPVTPTTTAMPARLVRRQPTVTETIPTPVTVLPTNTTIITATVNSTETPTDFFTSLTETGATSSNTRTNKFRVTFIFPGTPSPMTPSPQSGNGNR